MAKLDAAFTERNIRFFSFAKLSNRLKKTLETGVLNKRVPLNNKINPSNTKRAPNGNKALIATEDIIDLNNTVLIIDEVHNLFRPLANQKAQHEYLKGHLLDPTKFPGLKIIILSATPGDNVNDILMLLNMIRDPTKPAITAPKTDDDSSVTRFKQDVRGLISYFEMSGDTTRFPIVTELDPMTLPMRSTQFEKYVEAYKKSATDKKSSNYHALAKENQLAKYWAPARKYSNMMFTFEKGMRATEFGTKLPALLGNINSYPLEKHYVYSAFNTTHGKGWSSQGILAIANFMERDLGYTKFNINEVGFECASKGSDCKITRLPVKRKRFLLVTSKEMGDDGSGASKSAGERLKKLLAVYNHPENRYGELIHVLLASNSYNEGIDLKSVRHIHFFEPLVTMASDKQTIGRAARFCSHADLDRDKGEWTVNVHRYMSYYPVNIELNTTTQNTSLDVKTGPTDDEFANIQRYEQQKATISADIADIELALEPLKKIKSTSKDEESVRKKAHLKGLVDGKKKQVKNLESTLKTLKTTIEARGKDQKKKAKASKSKKIDTSNIKMIDEFIYNESREHVKELLVVYQSMKEAAVDCRLLDKFHALSGNRIKCTDFPKQDFKIKDLNQLNDHKKLNNFFFGR
jgi:hypothetical protein